MTYRLDLQVDVLRWLGVFPPVNGGNATAMAAFSVYRVMFFAVVGVVTLSMTVQVFVAPDLSVVARTVDMWTMCFSGLYKWACMTWYCDRYAEFHTRLLTIGDQGTKAYCQPSGPFLVRHMKSTRRVIVVYLITGVALSAFLIASPLITYPKGDRSDFVYFNDPKSYPLSCWMPFTINGYTLFYSMFALKSTVLFIAVNLYLSIDTFMFGAIYAIGGQIELLNASLNTACDDLTIDDSGLTTRFGSEKKTIWHSRLCECIKFHTMILDYISKLEAMFRSLLLADYLHAIISLTFAMFQTTVSVGESISLVFFIFVSVVHQFFNNFFGEYIIQKQISVGETTYFSPWWRADKTIGQCVSIMINRANKPKMMTGFYMYKLCFRSFIAFVKRLYTYYMVLRNIESANGQKSLSF